MPQAQDRARRGSGIFRYVRVVAPVAALSCLALVAVADVAAAASARITTNEVDGYGRLLLTFEEDIPEVSVEVAGGVAVISFSEPTELEVERIVGGLPAYVNVVRRDPDSRAVRLALIQSVSIAMTPAAERIYIDFLPSDWEGPPPGLPAEVVEELARRAQEAERLAREAAERAPLAKVRIDADFIAMPTFGRFVFTPTMPVEMTMERDAVGLNVVFTGPSTVRLGDLRARLPDYVSDLTRSSTGESTTVRLAISPDMTVRDFREGEGYVLDVIPPAGYLDQAAVSAPARAEAGDDEADAAADAEQAAADRAPEPEAAPALPGEAGPPGEAAPSLPEAGKVVAERDVRGLKLIFTFPAPTATAVFERMQVLWMVLSTREPIDAGSLRSVAPDLIRDVQNWQTGNATIFRLVLARPLLATVEAEERRLTVVIGGPDGQAGTPISMRRSSNEAGGAVAEILLTGAGELHQFEDPETGGHLMVVTADGPARPIRKTQRFVDFTLWPTAHALAIERISDGLEVSLQGPVVRVSRPRGLSLSAASSGSLSTLNSRDASAEARPAFVELEPSLPRDVARARILEQIRLIAAAPELSRTAERLALVRTYLSVGMGAEALGVLDVALAAEGSIGEDPHIRALRGIALLQMHRSKEALEALEGFQLSQSTDAALWRSQAYAQLGEWEKALTSFARGRPALASYPPAQRRELLFGQAEAALEIGDPALAASALDQAQDADAGKEGRYLFLDGWLAELNGDRNRAMAAYELVAAQEPLRDPIAAKARLKRILLGHEMGEIGDDEATEALERLTLTWRGDEIEFEASAKLAKLYSAANDYRRAFELMKNALTVAPDSPIIAALQDDMEEVFEKLFLGDASEGLSAVDALALYYDFKDMTPIGRKGDEMIRSLAERLISLDLLDQAADLLDYQVENRLTGAARAQVATRLATVQLMLQRPAEALKVLTRTRQAQLPSEMENERILLEARALGETGRAELALDLLAGMNEDVRVRHARAKILWADERWQDAGEEYERILGETWDEASPLAERARKDVLRAGIAYAMAGDRLSAQRLRTKFLDKMAASSDARAFDVVTQPASAKEGELEAVVRGLAETDGLRAFMEEYSAATDPAEAPKS